MSVRWGEALNHLGALMHLFPFSHIMGGVGVEIPASLGARFPHTTDVSPLEGAIL